MGTLTQIRQGLGFNYMMMAYKMEICIGRWKALEEDKEEMNTEELARLALISGKKTTEIVTK